MGKNHSNNKKSVSAPSVFFESVVKTFRNAEAKAGSITKFYRIGNCLVRLCFAGPALVPLITPALEHLEIEREQWNPKAPFLKVCLADSASTGEKMPCAQINGFKGMGPGKIWIFQNDFHDIISQFTDGLFHILEKCQNLAIFWINDVAKLPVCESGSPLLKIFHWWMNERGRQLVHAGAVGLPEKGVLLVGKGGTGKSTTALACLCSNLGYAGDDYCLVSTKPRIYAHSLYNSGKIKLEDKDHFPFLYPALNDSCKLDTGKALVFIHRHFPEKTSNGFPLKAIFIPQISGLKHTELRQVSPAKAYLALVPSTIYQLPGVEQKAFQIMGEMIKKLPCYVLEIGTDLSLIPDTILNFLG